MSKLHIDGRMRSCNPDAEEIFHRYYDGEGNLTEVRLVTNEIDYNSGVFLRTSTDNGKTWSQWETAKKDEAGARRNRLPGNEFGDEYNDNCILGTASQQNNANAGMLSFAMNSSPTLYHEQSGCSICAGTSFYYLRGHDVGYFDIWEKGEDNMRTHAYFAFRRPDGSEVKRMFEFEEGGEDFDINNQRNPAFLDKNRAQADSLQILPDGDICVVLLVTMRLCCRMAGVDMNTFFPSCPDLQFGVVIARGHWNPETEDFEFSYSNPVMVSDLQSSRGFMEPRLTFLKNGRWLLVARGSNWSFENWHTRINPSAPGFKWYAFSDDGGRTFTPAMPWHFDTREVVYSPASICSFFRSGKNGKLYWIGNYIDQPWKICSNDPRNILQICEVDDTYGHLIKDTLTVIDGVREGQTYVELSNFGLLEDKDTLNLEIRLTKVNFNGGSQGDGDWYSEAWEYNIEFEE